MSLFKKLIALLCLLSSTYSFAQFLPNNTALNVQSVQRWMDSNRDFASLMQALDDMHKTEADLKTFDALPAAEQDQKITAFLQQKKLIESTNSLIARHGWKSVGEYMRLSTKLGNAIAAYFFTEEIAKVSDSYKKALREKTDPAVLAVPQEDIIFVKNNEKLLKDYIQAYAKGR
jgi:wyosine [tRNA(Phe)-imidazoG37] synthetase (radical SAM superfamily)